MNHPSVIAIAHDSAGPKFDIVLPGCGFLARTADEYAACMQRVLTAPAVELRAMQAAGVVAATRFSNEAFVAAFLREMRRGFAGVLPGETALQFI